MNRTWRWERERLRNRARARLHQSDLLGWIWRAVGWCLETVIFQSDRTENRVGLKSSFTIRVGSLTHAIRFQSNRPAARSNQIPLRGGSCSLAVLWGFSLICSCTWNSETCSQGCMEIDPAALPNKSISQWLRLTLENRELMWAWPRGGPGGMGFRFS